MLELVPTHATPEAPATIPTIPSLGEIHQLVEAADQTARTAATCAALACAGRVAAIARIADGYLQATQARAAGDRDAYLSTYTAHPASTDLDIRLALYFAYQTGVAARDARRWAVRYERFLAAAERAGLLTTHEGNKRNGR